MDCGARAHCQSTRLQKRLLAFFHSILPVVHDAAERLFPRRVGRLVLECRRWLHVANALVWTVQPGKLHQLQQSFHLFDADKLGVAQVVHTKLAHLEATARGRAHALAPRGHDGHVLVRLHTVTKRTRLVACEHFVHVLQRPCLLSMIQRGLVLVTDYVALGASRVRIHHKHTRPKRRACHVAAFGPVAYVVDDVKKAFGHTRHRRGNVIIIHEALGGKHVKALGDVCLAILAPCHDRTTELPPQGRADLEFHTTAL